MLHSSWLRKMNFHVAPFKVLVDVDKGKLTTVANSEKLTFQVLVLHERKVAPRKGLTVKTLK